jgi:PBSX family phage terminase large subunit
VKIKSFSPKQKRVMTWWRSGGGDCGYDAIICDGAVRSGKTLCESLSFVCWAMASFDKTQFAFCGKSVAALRRNIVAELLRSLTELGFTCEEKRAQNRIDIRLGKRENSFYLFGGYDEKSSSLIQGATFAGVLLDEVALMPRSFVEQACARCSVSGSRLWFRCNPEGPQHWFYREWILRARERNALYLHFTMDDNPSLSPRIKARYRNSYAGTFYRRFILGEWTQAQGLVYDFYDREKFAVPAPEERIEKWAASVDYGTANPASFGLWGKTNGIWYRTDEYYYDSRLEGRQKTDEEYIDDFHKLVNGKELERVIVDPSAASFIQALSRAGYSVEKADNDVLSGIRVTADMLRNGKIVICDCCADCLREMELYCWDEKCGGRDAPKKENDHAMDDMRYFAMSAARENSDCFFAGYVERST